MSEISFHEDNEFHIRSRKLLGEPETPSMIRFLLRTGIVKDEKQALYVLIGVIVVALSSAVFLIRSEFSNPEIEYVVDKNGNKIETEEYIRMLGRGENPLN
jgi:hypothetical protein